MIKLVKYSYNVKCYERYRQKNSWTGERESISQEMVQLIQKRTGRWACEDEGKDQVILLEPLNNKEVQQTTKARGDLEQIFSHRLRRNQHCHTLILHFLPTKI